MIVQIMPRRPSRIATPVKAVAWIAAGIGWAILYWAFAR